MNSKQRAYLRGLAMKMQPIMNIGKGGITENSIIQIDQSLEAHELIKIAVLPNSDLSASDIIKDIAIATRSIAVQAVGNKITLFRVSQKKGIEHIDIAKIK